MMHAYFLKIPSGTQLPNHGLRIPSRIHVCLFKINDALERSFMVVQHVIDFPKYLEVSLWTYGLGFLS